MINPVILFVPVSSDKGIGEYTRSAIIADEIKRQIPQAEIHFILNRNMKSSQDCLYTTHFSNQSATKDTPLVNSVITKLKPNLVVFDCAGRSKQFVHAKKSGAKIMFISQHHKKRARGLKLRRLLFCDSHLVVQPEFAIRPLSFIERLKLKLSARSAPQNIGPIMPKISGNSGILERLSLLEESYIVFSPGSGGHELNGELASDVFYKAAKKIAKQNSVKVVMLFGAHYPKDLPLDEQLVVLSHLNTNEFLELLYHAKIRILSAGSTLLQVIEMKKPSIAVAISKDQPTRLEACVSKNFVLSAALDETDICRQIENITKQKMVEKISRALETHRKNTALEITVERIKELLSLPVKTKAKKHLFYISQNYSFEILRPIQEVLLERGDICCWFVDSSTVNLDNFNENETVLDNIELAVSYKPDVVFVPGNYVPNFISGLKVQVFHGLEWKKKGHFKIRGFFDLYCTHGAITTKVFRRLEEKHGYFKVKETGWPKLDPLFKTQPLNIDTSLPIVLYAPTFSPNLTSAADCFNEIKKLILSGKHYWIIKFHPKMSQHLMEPYKALHTNNLMISDSDSSLPLLQTADVMISDTSSIVGEFLLLEKPVITYRNKQPGDYLIDIDDPSLMESALETALAKERELIDRIKCENQRIHPYNDGKSTMRVIAEVDKLLANNEVSNKPLNLVRNLKLRKRTNYWKFL